MDGLIVMINSISGKRSNPWGVAYNASKFGMTALGACVSEEERKRNQDHQPLSRRSQYPDFRQAPRPAPAEHRAKILQPEDIAQAVLLLANSLPAMSRS